jgi:hypothetical protein
MNFRVNLGGRSVTLSPRETPERPPRADGETGAADAASGWHANNKGWDTADRAAFQPGVFNPGGAGDAGVFNAVLQPGFRQARFIPVQAQRLPQEQPEGGAPKFGSAAPKTNPGAGGQSAKVVPFPTSQAPTLTPQEVPRSVPNGLQRLGVLIGVAEAGWEFGGPVGHWYFGQEGVIAKGIGSRVIGQVDKWSAQGREIGTHVGFSFHFSEQGNIDYANDYLSLKAGFRVDFRTMEPDALAGLIEAPWPDAATIRQNSKWLQNDPEMSKDRRGYGTGPLSATYATTRTAMAKSADPCKNMPGERHHEIPAELMDKHADFLNKIGYSLDYGLSRANARAPHSGEAEALIRLPSSDSERIAMSTIPGCGDRTIHNGSHGEYAKAVDEQLGKIETEFRAGRLDEAGARASVGRLLDGVRNLLRNRFANMNDPALVQAIRNLAL